MLDDTAERAAGGAAPPLPAGVALRPATDADLPFLAELYASTRRDEVAQTPWSDEQKEAFLRWQFDAQHAHYLEHYPDCDRRVIERHGEPVGRLYVDRWESEIRLVDVALLPGHRGGGLGGALVARLLDEGRASGKPVSIHVEHNNPALRLYRRLGFRHVDSNGIYYLMRWEPEGHPADGGDGGGEALR
jgi:ribosomal protein S18 acetylase RimI-like enzyme